MFNACFHFANAILMSWCHIIYKCFTAHVILKSRAVKRYVSTIGADKRMMETASEKQKFADYYNANEFPNKSNID